MSNDPLMLNNWRLWKWKYLCYAMLQLVCRFGCRGCSTAERKLILLGLHSKGSSWFSLVTESPSCLNMHTVSLHSQPKWLLSLGNSSWWQHVQAVQGHGKTRAWTRENCQKQVAIHLDESSKEFNLQYTMRILSDAQVRTNLFNSVVEILSWATWARHVMQSFQWPEQSAGKLTNIWQWSSKYGQPFPAVLYRSFYVITPHLDSEFRPSHPPSAFNEAETRKVACLWVVESLRIPRHASELLEKVWTLLFVKKILCLVYHILWILRIICPFPLSLTSLTVSTETVDGTSVLLFAETPFFQYCSIKTRCCRPLTEVQTMNL